MNEQLTTVTAITACKACGNKFSGRYCNQCGEKVYTNHDKSLFHFFEEGIHFLTHFEGTFFTTLRALFTQPGKLSVDYCNGLRKKYFKPIPLFLFSVVLYLLFSSFQGLNMPLRNYVTPKVFNTKISVPPVQRKMKERNLTFEELARRYDAKSPKIAKVLLFLYIPLGALVLYVLHFRKRRYYSDHVVLATEITSFFVLTQYVVLFLLMLLCTALYPPSGQWFDDGSLVWDIFHLLFVVFVLLSIRRFYSTKLWWVLVATAVFILFFTFVIRSIYTVTLFYTVLLFL